MRISDWSSDVCSSDLPDDTKPSTAMITSKSGNSETNAASAIDDESGPPPIAPKRSVTQRIASSHGQRARHRAMSNTRDQYPGRVRFDRVPVPGVDPDRLPTHVACVMEGNGRWATRRGLKRTAGHPAGEVAALDAV